MVYARTGMLGGGKENQRGGDCAYFRPRRFTNTTSQSSPADTRQHRATRTNGNTSTTKEQELQGVIGNSNSKNVYVILCYATT